MPGDIVEVSGKPGLREKGVPGIQKPYVNGEDKFGGSKGIVGGFWLDSITLRFLSSLLNFTKVILLCLFNHNRSWVDLAVIVSRLQIGWS